MTKYVHTHVYNIRRQKNQYIDGQIDRLSIRSKAASYLVRKDLDQATVGVPLLWVQGLRGLGV